MSRGRDRATQAVNLQYAVHMMQYNGLEKHRD